MESVNISRIRFTLLKQLFRSVSSRVGSDEDAMRSRSKCHLIAAVFLSSMFVGCSGQGERNVVPNDQKSIKRIFAPAAAERTKPGVGKFVIFTNEPLESGHDRIATAWECIPSRRDIPITKRVEFCKSSADYSALLSTVPVPDFSYGMYPRFVRLSVPLDTGIHGVSLHDINYRTWDVRCIWQGEDLHPFGVLGDSIFCTSSEGGLLFNVHSGKLSREIAFHPLYATDDGFWVVKKLGETKGCWSYSVNQQKFIAQFGDVDVDPTENSFQHFRYDLLSPDGKSRAWHSADIYARRNSRVPRSAGRNR